MDAVIDVERAANTLRAWALDENLKRRVLDSPDLAAIAGRVARRYTAGDTIEEAMSACRVSVARGHLCSVEYAGESIRDTDLARAETRVFLDLAAAVRVAGLPCTISFDLSHVGAVVDRDLALEHGRRMAQATAQLGTALMISAEGSARTDLVLDLYEQLVAEFPHVGVTIQARLHRTPADLDRLLGYPGTVRLVKGAFLEPDEVAYRRGSHDLVNAYRQLARRLIAAGQPTSIATHDETLVGALIDEHGDSLHGDGVEFEMLLGLGTDLLDRLHGDGYRTREYVVFGGQWWLYVLNRIAEQPERVLLALADLNDS